ncbi:MAG TPA: hypothetical protein VMS73_10060 [Anaerolineaceae bacterium]|nr:hypothetical protein [Anaerolineaceae bacterium]
MDQDKTRDWKFLFNLGGIAALLATFVFRRNLGAELLLLRGLGLSAVPEKLPADAAGWFALLHQQPLVGLTLLEALDLVEYALVGLIFLAVSIALWKVNRSALLVAAVGGWAGIITYFASNQAFALLALSERYTAAATEAQRVSLLSAGEALLAVYNPGVLHQGTGIYICMFLVPLAGLIMSLVMLQSHIFSKATAVTGILANGVILCYFPVLAFAPSMLALPYVLSAPFRVAWYFLIALKLFKLGKGA